MRNRFISELNYRVDIVFVILAQIFSLLHKLTLKTLHSGGAEVAITNFHLPQETVFSFVCVSTWGIFAPLYILYIF